MNCISVLPHNCPHEQWLAERRGGLTSSDAAAVCGLSPWRTARDVYFDKRGEFDEETSEPMRWGTRLEPIVAKAYEDLMGWALTVPPKLVRSVEHDWLLASLDRVCDGIDSDNDTVVELKTARMADGWGPSRTDEIPEHYLLQVTHQLLVTGTQSADVAVLIGGNDFRVYHLERNAALCDRLFAIEQEFWTKHHLANVPPEPDWSHSRTPELIALMGGFEPGPAAILGADVHDLWKQWQALGEVIKAGEQATKQRKLLKAQIEHAMNGRVKAVFPNGEELYRAQRHNRGYEVAPFDYTVLTTNQPKGK